jgi:sortase A
MTALDDRAAPREPGHSARRRNGRPPVRMPAVLVPRKKHYSDLSMAANWVLFALVGLIAWTVFYALLISSLEHSHDQSVMYSKLRQQLAEGTAPISGIVKPGSPIAVLDAPTAGLKQEVVVEGSAAGDLIKGPGHLRNTPLPGQAGVSVIYGRAALFGGPFHRIASVHAGDPITVTTGEGTATYVVERVRRAGDSFPLLATGAGRLTLITADSTGWRSKWAPTGVVYVDARLTSTPFVDGGGRLSAVPPAEQAMKGDTGALYGLVLWLLLITLAALGAVWAHHRWGRWQTWLIGTPVLLACLWGVTLSGAQFLPNLM